MCTNVNQTYPKRHNMVLELSRGMGGVKHAHRQKQSQDLLFKPCTHITNKASIVNIMASDNYALQFTCAHSISRHMHSVSL